MSKSKAPKARKKVNRLTQIELGEALEIARKNGQEKGLSRYWLDLLKYVKM